MESVWPLPDVSHLTPRQLISRLRTIERRLSNAREGREEVLSTYPQMVTQLEGMKIQARDRLREMRERGDE